MYAITPAKKLFKTLLSTAIKIYGTDCKHYTKLNSKQDDVYGVHGGISPVQKNEEGIAYSLYGSPEEIPSIFENNEVFEEGLESVNEAINLKDFKQINNIRLLLPSSEFRVGGFSSGFYESSGYAWTICPEQLLSGDLLMYETDTGGVVTTRVLYPEIKGKDETYLIRFVLSNVGDNFV